MGDRSRVGRAGAVVLGAVLLSGCIFPDLAPPEQDPSAAPSASPEGSSTSPSPSPSGSPSDGTATDRPAVRRGARAQVPDAVILEQLRRAAERIAQRLPLETPEPTPTDIDPGSNRALGFRLMLDFGFARGQWQYLDALWHRESGWNHLAENKSSGAYGIPQSLPGTKMAVVGDDWRTNPETQIRWGLAYIAARYGNPEGAWAHSERRGWY